MWKLVSIVVLAQLASGQERGKWDPVPQELLDLKQPRLQADAEAEIVHNRYVLSRVSELGGLTLKRSVRLKLYNASGVQNWSMVSLTSAPGVEYSDIAARTVTADGTVYPLDRADLVERQITKGFRRGQKAKSFTAPKAQPGAVIDYQYQVKYKEASQIELVIQDDIPTWSFNVALDTDLLVRWTTNRGKLQTRKDGRLLSLFAERIAAFQEEPMMPPESRARGMVILVVTSVLYNVTWSDLATAFYDEFDQATRPNKQVTAVAQQLTSAMVEDQEKLTTLDRFCRIKIQNLSAADSSAGANPLKGWKPSRSRRRNPGTKNGYRPGDQFAICLLGPRGGLRSLPGRLGRLGRAAGASRRSVARCAPCFPPAALPSSKAISGGFSIQRHLTSLLAPSAGRNKAYKLRFSDRAIRGFLAVRMPRHR